MAQSGLCCGLYRGSIYLRDLGNPNGALLPVGNAEATITSETTEVNQPNYQSLGGNACSVSYVESVGIDMTLHCTSPENMAIAFSGSTIQAAAGTATDELHTVNAEGELIALDHAPNKDSIVVTKASTTYVVNEDYTVTNAGIIILEGTSMVLGDEIEVSYTYASNWVVEALNQGQKTFELVLDGENIGDDGSRAVVLKAWRVKIAPTDSFALIASEFASIAVSGEILKDDSKPTGSKFFRIEYGTTASGTY